MMNKFTSYSLFVACSIFLITSCKKVEGPGGTSAITGNLSGITLSSSGGGVAEQEITTVICTHADGIGGSILDNSDYFLLNTPSGVNYYIWYENTNWLGQDPGLSGRIGIKVTYSNSESNVTVATNTAAAIVAGASADFTVSVSNDVVTIINVAYGEVIDADDINTPFAVDVSNQGKSASGGNSTSTTGVIADERVYIKYGDEDFYSETVRTDANGDYQFKGLTSGDYKIFAFSIDTLSPTLDLIEVEVSTSITEKKQVVTAPALTIVR